MIMGKQNKKDDRLLEELFRETGFRKVPDDFTFKVMDRVKSLPEAETSVIRITYEWKLFFLAAAAVAVLFIVSGILPEGEGVIQTSAKAAALTAESFNSLFSYIPGNVLLIFTATLFPLLFDFIYRFFRKKDVKIVFQ